MDKRFIIALLLTSLVVIVTPVLFPTPKPGLPRSSTSGDTTSRSRNTSPVHDTTAIAPRPAVTEALPTQALTQSDSQNSRAPTSVLAAAFRAETTIVQAGNADFHFTNLGAQFLTARLHQFRSYRPGKEVIALRGEADPLIKYRLIDASGDSVVLESVVFERSNEQTASGENLRYRATTRVGVVEISYTPIPNSYMVRTAVRVDQQNQPLTLFVSLPGGLRSEEADTLDDREHLAFAVKTRRDDARRVQFKDLDPGETDTTVGPIVWAASKNKYFLTALLAPTDKDAFTGAVMTGGPRVAKAATRADIRVARVIPPGQTVTFEVYAGPQEWRRLNAMGRDFENVNPYGGFMQGLIQPFATIVMRVLLWMRETFKISYGWVLVVFGLLVRIITWPLNQSAMKTSLRMQRIQPQLAVVQQKYKNNPEKQREEIMQVYREHGMTPFSPLMGCLPMLLPMPVLFALFFVFQNTIEFRGVPFLWLPDISLHDPLYIIPIVMGLSMYALSWIGMRNAPPNPQAKMMGYILPVMMTVLFWRFASGLNLYYTVQNIAALPQQWLIARDRGKPAVATTNTVSRR
jgi:YidC/Oxa1 family membrane protein insertase